MSLATGEGLYTKLEFGGGGVASPVQTPASRGRVQRLHDVRVRCAARRRLRAPHSERRPAPAQVAEDGSVFATESLDAAVLPSDAYAFSEFGSKAAGIKVHSSMGALR